MVTLVLLIDKIRGILDFSVVHSDEVERRIAWCLYTKSLTLFHGAGSCLQVIDTCLFSEIY